MPFINSKVTVKLDKKKRDDLAREYGKAISIMGKPESYLMLGFEDETPLYMGGRELEKGAMITVEALGDIRSDAADRMTAAICDILERNLEIPGNNVYVTYQGFRDWGHNGRNF
ncbi:MAG TPA: hypothetical protein DCX21_05045 [Eubacterium sp.]|nr:hypothetical protein [Lachnospiraceae bacterium]HAZ91325.1 hypothetical protein [Eubacterium sp.]HBZ53749.1 hypothetical protein [Eubacterium sp.]